MAAVMTKAIRHIQSQNARLRSFREQRKTEITMVRGMVAGGAGAVGAALVDAKWGEGDEPAKVFGVPINAALGTGMAVAALAFEKMPMRMEIGAAGAVAALCSAYDYVKRNVEFE